MRTKNWPGPGTAIEAASMRQSAATGKPAGRRASWMQVFEPVSVIPGFSIANFCTPWAIWPQILGRGSRLPCCE
jgi:hypothetical protein